MGRSLASTMSIAPAPQQTPQSNDPCWCGSGRKYKRCHKASEGRVLPGIVSPMLTVPAHIPRTRWADTGDVERRSEPLIKTPETIERMRRTCKIAADILARTGAFVKPGITTDEIDKYCHQLYIDHDSFPSTLNYHDYPKSLCTSVNEVICHGIPDSRVLQEGDIVNLDVTAYKEGVHGDCNATFFVGEVAPEFQQLVKVTKEAMWKGIEAVKPGMPINVIGRAIEEHVRPHRYGVVRVFVGHGIGEEFHNDIQVPHYYDPKANMIMQPGMTFTIEPMITIGSWRHLSWDDGWTAVTSDGKRTAQFEHTVLVTDTGVEVLTLL
jgi:methionyl aminopeptidase